MPRKRQVALNGDFTVSKHEFVYPSWSTIDNTLSHADLTSTGLFSCSICRSMIQQGIIFRKPYITGKHLGSFTTLTFNLDCDCDDGNFEICESCYLAGNTCHDESHAFMTALCALDCSYNPRYVSSCRRNKSGISAMQCSHCERNIPQGLTTVGICYIFEKLLRLIPS